MTISETQRTYNLKELFEIRDALEILKQYGVIQPEEELLSDVNREIGYIRDGGSR